MRLPSNGIVFRVHHLGEALVLHHLGDAPVAVRARLVDDPGEHHGLAALELDAARERGPLADLTSSATLSRTRARRARARPCRTSSPCCDRRRAFLRHRNDKSIDVAHAQPPFVRRGRGARLRWVPALGLRQIGFELFQGAAPALVMLAWPASKVLRSSAVALCGDQRTVNLVLPPGCSSNVNTDSISSGQVGAIGWRVMPPASSENELMNTMRSRRHDLAIDHLAPHRRAVRRLHAVVVGAAGAQIHLRGDHREALRAPPLLHVLRIGEALPHQLARRVEHAAK